MIERIFKNELSIKRWRRFKSQRRAMVSLAGLICLIFLSATAEIWSNSKPIILHYQDKTYFPVFKTYHPSEFGREDILQMDYKNLSMDAQKDWAIWPVIKWDPFESNKTVTNFPSPPTNENVFGTDQSGRDVFSRLLYGFRYTFIFSILVWFLSSVIGMVIGGITGYFGGLTDMVGQRLIEIFESLPQLLLLITLIAIFSPNIYWLVVFASIFSWIGISQYIRAEFLKIRKREFVEAAVAQGASTSRIMFGHILINSLTPWITLTPFMISGLVAYLATLDYLGFGLPVPTPSWGELLNQARTHFTVAWWLALFPSVALFATLVMLNLIGEGVRFALDPRRQ